MFKNTTNNRATQQSDYAHARGGAPTGCARRGGSLLSTAHISPFYEIAEGASLLKASTGCTCPAVGGGKRNPIKGFTRASRLRLMRTIARVRRDADLPCFVTLTYPGEFPTVERAKRDLDVFLKRLRRHFPKAGGIWKLEPQQRGAPHYHMLVWGVAENDLFTWVVVAWYDIAGNGDQNHLLFHSGHLPGSKPCVTRVRSFRGVWSYASKYLGKTFEIAEWGSLWTGRYWAVFQPVNIPFGALRQTELTLRQVHDLQRYQRRFTGMRSRRWQRSITMFCDANQWDLRMAELLSG